MKETIKVRYQQGRARRKGERAGEARGVQRVKTYRNTLKQDRGREPDAYKELKENNRQE